MSASTRPVVAFILLIVVELLAFYICSFAFMLDGTPENHGRLLVQVIDWTGIGIAVVGPVIIFAWLIGVFRRNK